jgi:short-subunit dehydrogenase
VSKLSATPSTALVTGASSGIGKAFAMLLASEGTRLVITSRDERKLLATKVEIEKRYPIEILALAEDLAKDGAARRLFDRVQQEEVEVDLLINNAGFNVHGRFEKTDLDQELEMIRLHIIAVTELTKFFLRQRPRGAHSYILNVSSIAALVPGPLVSVHFATRAHILSFSLALAEEFRGDRVQVTCLCPGPTKSNFYVRAEMEDVRLISGWPLRAMSAESVAAAGVRGLKRGRVLVIPGLQNKVLAFCAKIAPRKFGTLFSAWLMRRR